jgi:hypothetical protein
MHYERTVLEVGLLPLKYPLEAAKNEKKFIPWSQVECTSPMSLKTSILATRYQREGKETTPKVRNLKLEKSHFCPTTTGQWAV